MEGYEIEVTDTFGGEANYCWVRRGHTQAKSRRAVIAAVKKVGGWEGFRVKTEDWGDTIAVRPQGLLQVGFATWSDEIGEPYRKDEA